MTFVEKHLTVPPPIMIAGRHIKRYHVNVDSTPIPDDIEQAAYAMVPALLPALDDTPPAAFVVLHRGGDGASYVNAYSWVWDNVIHYATAAAAQPVLDCPDDDPTNFVALNRPWLGCIWELPPLGHERSAWVRHIIKPDRPDLSGYLADSLPEGPTGGPTGGPAERVA
ncbi:MAG: hypothetical protein JWN99_747 [Ilumatobacteraceae bacterium]|nr:hypothetical protein [Ilumatobacteraceae bacterium]